MKPNRSTYFSELALGFLLAWAAVGSVPSAHALVAAPSPPDYRFIALPAVSGQNVARAEDINNAGIVVGYSADDGGSSVTWNSEGVPWGLPIGRSNGYGVNDLGRITGTLVLGGGIVHGYFYDGVTLKDVHTSTLDTVGNFSLGLAVNNADQVVGWAGTGGGGPRSAYLWQNDTAILLGTLGGPESAAFAVNNVGQVGGYAETPNRNARAFIWSDTNANGTSEPGEMVQLPDMGLSSAVNSINDVGVAAGFVVNASFRRQPVIWTDASEFTPLPLLPGTDEAEVFALNNLGVAVGFTPGKGGTLWYGGKVFNLNDLVSLSGSFRINHVLAINDQGWIVGDGFIGGQETGFLLIPVPEPTTSCLVAWFAITLAFARHCRVTSKSLDRRIGA